MHLLAHARSRLRTQRARAACWPVHAQVEGRPCCCPQHACSPALVTRCQVCSLPSLRRARVVRRARAAAPAGGHSAPPPALSTTSGGLPTSPHVLPSRLRGFCGEPVAALVTQPAMAAAAAPGAAGPAFEPARASAQLPAMCSEAAMLLRPDAGALEAVCTQLRRAAQATRADALDARSICPRLRLWLTACSRGWTS